MKRILIVLALLASPAAAQDSFAFSPDATNACLAQGGGASCIGASANQCMDDNAGGFSTVGQRACIHQELEYWDAQLNEAYQALFAQTKEMDDENADIGHQAPVQSEALREMQRAWITYRDTRCAFERSLWGNGTGGGTARLGCLMQETGEQALYLRGQAEWFQ